MGICRNLFYLFIADYSKLFSLNSNCFKYALLILFFLLYHLTTSFLFKIVLSNSSYNLLLLIFYFITLLLIQCIPCMCVCLFLAKNFFILSHLHIISLCMSILSFCLLTLYKNANDILYEVLYIL